MIFLDILLFNPYPPRMVAPPSSEQEFQREQELREVLLNRQLMHQQNTEYAQALAADKARREEQARLETEMKQEEIRLKKEQEEFKKKKQKLLDLRKEICNSLLLEEVPNSDEDNVVRIRVKFPNGYVLNRKFFVNDSLEVFFTYKIMTKFLRNFSMLYFLMNKLQTTFLLLVPIHLKF